MPLTSRTCYNCDCKVRRKRFVLDGKAIEFGVNGICDFNVVHPCQLDHEAKFCIFDALGRRRSAETAAASSQRWSETATCGAIRRAMTTATYPPNGRSLSRAPPGQ